MTSGRRADFPSRGVSWIDYSSPVKGWAYWEDKSRFGPIGDDGKKEILRELHFFRVAQAEYVRTPKRNLKQLKRDLDKVKKTETFPDEALPRFVIEHTLDFNFLNPDARMSERVGYLLAEIEADPSGFMMSGPKPQILFTLTLFEVFSRLGLNVSRGSAADMHVLTDKSEAPDTPFVEFVARMIWDVPEDAPISVKMVGKIQKIVVRKSNYEQGD